jgi:hypothetical protein
LRFPHGVMDRSGRLTTVDNLEIGHRPELHGTIVMFPTPMREFAEPSRLRFRESSPNTAWRSAIGSGTADHCGCRQE